MFTAAQASDKLVILRHEAFFCAGLCINRPGNLQFADVDAGGNINRHRPRDALFVFFHRQSRVDIVVMMDRGLIQRFELAG